jgi:hypothetical protein
MIKRLVLLLCLFMLYQPCYGLDTVFDAESNFPDSLDDQNTNYFDKSDGDTVQHYDQDVHSDAIIEIEEKLGYTDSTPADDKVLTGTGASTSEWGTLEPTMITVIDAPADGECLAYDLGTTSFEWVICGGAGSGDPILVNTVAVDPGLELFDGDIVFYFADDGGTSSYDRVTATVACTECIDATDMGASSVGASEIIDYSINTDELASDDFGDFACDGAGTCTVESFAAAAVALPGADGAAGQQLVTDGLGTMSWASPGAATPGGNFNEVQYNNSGVLGGVGSINSDGTDLQVEDDAEIRFGDDDDWAIDYDTGDSTLVFDALDAAAVGVSFLVDDNNSDSTFAISNSSGANNANLTVDGDITSSTGFFGDLTGAVTGNADTATALAANGLNCSAGSFPLGVDAYGARESCTDAATQAELDAWIGSANIVTLGTIGTGTWEGTAIANAYVASDITIDNITQITTRPAESLTSSCANAQVLGGTLAGTGVECQADDDDPEAGDVAWTDLTDSGTFTNTRICTASGDGAAAVINCDTLNTANAAGDDKEIQYNDGGTNLGGIASVIWDDANFEFADEQPVAFGTDANWLFQYNETGTPSDQILITTTGTASTATGAPMMLILADSGTASGTNMTADQDIFGIGKGTQATHADLFTVDEDGDVQISSGYLHVGTGSTQGTTPGVDDVFIEGTLEVDGACDFDGAVDIAGALTGMTSVTVNASATPTITLDDSDTTVETSDAVIYAQATDPVTDQEDVDVFIQTQINSTLTDVIDIDADGDLELGTATMDTMVNGDLTVTGGDITNGTVTIAAGAASGFTSLAIDNNASPQIVLDDSTHANVDGSIVVASVDANDANLVLNTKVATALVPFITIDGVLEEVLLGKKLDIASLGIENVGNIADDAAFSIIATGAPAVTIEDMVVTGGAVSGVTTLAASSTVTGAGMLPATPSTDDLGSTAAEWDDAYFGDTSVVYFGVGQETSLTYAAGTDTITLDDNLTVTGTLTGNLTGNASGTCATVTTAAQPAITSVGTLTSVVSSGAISGTTGTFTGNITGLIPPIEDSDGNATMADTDCVGQVYYNNTANNVYILPAAAPGLSLCFYADSAHTITIRPLAAGDDHIWYAGTDCGEDDDLVSPATVGAFICLHAKDTQDWMGWGSSETWVCE